MEGVLHCEVVLNLVVDSSNALDGIGHVVHYGSSCGQHSKVDHLNTVWRYIGHAVHIQIVYISFICV